MKKAELITALVGYSQTSECRRWRGQHELILFFVLYFQGLDIPADTKWDHWQIDNSIPQLLVGAIEEFRTSSDPEVSALREAYERSTEREMPDLTDISGDGVIQSLTAHQLGSIFAPVTGLPQITSQIDQVFSAARYLLQQRLYLFVVRVFTKGLGKFIEDTPERGMSGEFGQTTMRTYYIAGRQLFTLARPSSNDEEEHSLTFICEDGDPLALGIGIQSVRAELTTALDMIDDVINHWPTELEKAWMMVAPDEKISLG